MGYYTTFEINIVGDNEVTPQIKEAIVKQISELAQKGDDESLSKISKLIESKDKSLTQKVCDELNEITDYDFILTTETSIQSNMGEIKWYDSIDDLLKVSKAVPEALIQVDGEGEESGDIWRSYYRGGKMQKANVEITYEDFDETKLT